MKKQHVMHAGGLLLCLLVLSSSGLSTSFDDSGGSCRTVASDEPVVVVMGFEPFDVYKVNPSQLIAEALQNTTVVDARVIGVVLPVEYEASVEQVVEAIEQYDPVLVISTGLSADAKGVEVEKVGVNLKTVVRDDGRWSLPRRIDTRGPLFRLSPFPVWSLVQMLSEKGIAASMSVHAGLYICNAVLYETLGYISEQEMDLPCGFLHVPLLDSQDPEGMALEVMIDAVEQTIIYLRTTAVM